MDVHKICELLQLEWKKYEKRDCDLFSVSFMTTAAIDSMPRLEEHFAAAFPNMASYQVLAKQSYELEVLRENPEGRLTLQSTHTATMWQTGCSILLLLC